MNYRSYYMGLLSIFLISLAHADFSDKVMAPHLGPYKLEKSDRGICPDSLSIIAECTLGQLDLKKTGDLDFDFILLKGINSGEMRTTVKNQLVEKSLTTMKDLKITSKKSTYMPNYKVWFNETIELELQDKKFVLRKSQMDMKNEKSTMTLECHYRFDEAENKKILEGIKLN